MNRMTTTRSLVSILALVAGTTIAHAQCGNSLKLTAASPSEGDEIGAAMAYGTSNGNSRLIVGAPNADVGAFFGAGEVKLFAKISNQWGELATINKPTSGFHSDHFGQSVAISNGRLAIGAPGHQTNRGVAYIYEFTNAWTAVATISSSQVEQQVGAAVAIDGDYAFIGAPGTDTANNTDSGLVSIQRRVNGVWSQSQTISDTDFNGFYANRNLGAAIAAKDGLAVIGAPEGKEILWPNFHGYVRVVRLQANGQWATEAELLAPHPRRIGAHAGAAVATDGTRIVIAAPDYPYQTNPDGLNASSVGTVWVMKLDNNEWVTEQQVKTPSPTGLGRFGASVSINGDRLLVGEPGSKSAYAFRLTGGKWALDRAFHDEDDSANGAFGSSVALSDLNMFVGDSGDENNGTTDAGAVYLKALPAGYSDACDGALPLTGSTLSGCTMEATPDAVPFCGANSNSASGKGVWVTWTPACSGNVIMDTFGSNFDTVLSVHTACPGDPQSSVVVCDDDSFPSNDHLSLLTFNYTAGQTYYINVRGYGAAAGQFTLRVNQWQVPSNDQCSAPTTATAGNTYSFTNCQATTDANVSNLCGTANAVNDVWFRYNAAATGTLNLTTAGSNYDTILSVFQGGSCPAAAAIACNDDGGANGTSVLSVNVQANSSYLVRVAGYSTTRPMGDGSLSLSFQPSCGCDWNANGQLTVQDIFDFLAAYFSGSADMNQSGATTVQDIFDFLACYFGGC